MTLDINWLKRSLAAVALLTLTNGVSAEIWTDYSPSEAVTELTVVDVKTNFLDDYLVNLKTTWVRAMEVEKAMGSIVIGQQVNGRQAWKLRQASWQASEGVERRRKLL